MNIDEKIENWIQLHKEELIKDISTLISYPSISEDSTDFPPFGKSCQNVLKTYLEMAQGYGFSVQNHENYCGSVYLGQGEKTVGLWGHLDVVAAGQNWQYSPFECTEHNGFLIGRGTQDNKGPSMACLYAMRCIKECAFPISVKIQQILGCSEERGMQDVEYFVKNYSVPDFSMVADAAFPVCYGEKGICEIEIECTASFPRIISLQAGSASNIIPAFAEIALKIEEKDYLDKLEKISFPEGVTWEKSDGILCFSSKSSGGHVAFPENSVNAIFTLSEALLLSGILKKEEKELFLFFQCICKDGYGTGFSIDIDDTFSGRLTCSCSLLYKKNNKINIGINIRYPVTCQQKDFIPQIKNYIQKKPLFIRQIKDNPSYIFDGDDSFIKILTNAYNEITKCIKEPYVMGGGTYARKIPNAVAFGPGMFVDYSSIGLLDGHGACHSSDEAQSIDNLLQAIKIYTISLLRLSKQMNLSTLK